MKLYTPQRKQIFMPSGPLPRSVSESLSANLRRLRVKRGLTQEATAKAAALDLSYFLRIERCKANPSLRILCSLANTLGVEPARLLRKAKPIARRPGRPPGR